MHKDILYETQILESWHLNATPWVEAIRQGQIESRTRVTDQAIVDTVLNCAPRKVLDIGCGEGWLVRRLAALGIDTLGIDLESGLVEAARNAGSGDIRLMSYADLACGKLEQLVDVAVCNFSLLGKDSVDTLFQALPQLLHTGGSCIVQTLHPLFACGEHVYRDGWREGSWAGFSEHFTQPAPWYFRTLASWIALFENNGLQIKAIHEPLLPDTLKPASIIFKGTKSI